MAMMETREGSGHGAPVVPPQAERGGGWRAVLAWLGFRTGKAASADSRLAAIVNSSDDAIIGKTLEGIVTDWNRGAEAIFGYTAAEMVGQSFAKLLPPGKEAEEKAILDRIRRGERVDSLRDVAPAQGRRDYRSIREHLAGLEQERPAGRRVQGRARHYAGKAGAGHLAGTRSASAIGARYRAGCHDRHQRPGNHTVVQRHGGAIVRL